MMIINSRTDSTFKKRAPRAMKEIKKFAQKAMGTKDVRLDVLLNKFIWSKGVKNVPLRVRVQLHRYVFTSLPYHRISLTIVGICCVVLNSKRNEDEESSEKLYTHVTYVKTEDFKGLETKTVKEE
jgi:large subunit ribosomal protein L31e